MHLPSWLDLNAEVAAVLFAGQPVVALESAVIAHGLPAPLNLETALALEEAVRAEGATPATIGVWEGRPTVGLTSDQIRSLAEHPNVLKASRRDLALAVALGRTAATTVASTLFLAHQAGISVLATGGIGGAHRDGGQTWDISADLLELARTPVAVVCSGAKSILDIPRTLEILETHGVPVLGYRCHEFPAFFLHSSGRPINARIETVEEVAAVLEMHWHLAGAGVVVAQPLPPGDALPPEELEQMLQTVERRAASQRIIGKELTPFLLAGLAELSGGRTLEANRQLLLANARLAARIACVLAERRSRRQPPEALQQ